MPKHYYEPGTIRWSRWNGQGDVRYRTPAPGWKAEGVILDKHPITGHKFKDGQWWIKETKTQES